MLRDALESVLNQTLPAKEIVIIDDGSTDETPALVRNYQNKHARLKYHRTEGNFGAGKAARLGVDKSIMPYVAFLDSDDLWTPDHLEAAAIEFRDHPNLVMVFSRYGLVNARCGLLVDLVKEPHLTSPVKQLVLKKIIVQPTRTVIRREAIVEVGGVPLFPAAEDWVLAVLLAARFPKQILQSERRTAFFRLHGSQSASHPLQVQKALLAATEHIFTQLPSEYASLKPTVLATNLLHSAVFLWQGGQSGEAWRSLFRAVKTHPGSVVTREFWTALSRLVVPPSMGRAIRSGKRWFARRRNRGKRAHTATHAV
jgi:glycosyltransferase involved in cell wall biosynthesis